MGILMKRRTGLEQHEHFPGDESSVDQTARPSTQLPDQQRPLALLYATAADKVWSAVCERL
jgi:hypothetical protein